MARALWHADFEWRRDHLIVRDTGARVPLNRSIIVEFLRWLAFYVAMQPARFWAMATKPALRVGFTPAPPRPWYLAWATIRRAGARFVPVDRADIVMAFEDSTTTDLGGDAVIAPHARRINFACTDVSKSRVASVFETVFGYALAVDPETWTGPMVEKSEDNGVHDGRVLHGPCTPRPGKVYQRLIDTVGKDGLVSDLRCPTVAGHIPVTFIKRRPVGERFENANTTVSLADPDMLLSPDERAKLAEFAAAMGLDWGGIDVLRDRNDGRIYVVDVNKTDMGPPTALAIHDQLRAARRLAEAFRAAFQR